MNDTRSEGAGTSRRLGELVRPARELVTDTISRYVTGQAGRAGAGPAAAGFTACHPGHTVTISEYFRLFAGAHVL